MSLVPVTYIKAGETPHNWFDLSVRDNRTGRELRFVEEANTVEGWARCHVVDRHGRFVRDGDRVVSETVHGDFSIINPGVPGCPMAMEPEPRPRTFPTTRMFFERNGSAALVGPGGEARVEAQAATILMVLCGKAERHVTEWMDLAESIWPDADDMPDGWLVLIRVRVCELRKALKSINSEIRIVTHWGRRFSAARGPYPSNDNIEDAQVSKVATA